MAVLLGGMSGTNRMIAKTKRNQTYLNKAIEWGMKYYRVSDARDKAYGEDNERLARTLERQAEKIFDKHQEYLEMLPKFEQKRVEAFIIDNYSK